MTKKENSKTKEKPISEGKKVLAELASLKNEVEQLDQKAELQEKLGIRLYNQADIDKLFIFDLDQSAPYLRGKENKPKGEPIVLMKCKAEKGRPDYWYMFRKGRDAARLNSRYSPVPEKPKETIKELLDNSLEKRERLTVSERYGNKPKRNSRRY